MKVFIKLLFVLIALFNIQVFPLFSAEVEAVRNGSKIDVTIDGKLFTSYIFSPEEKYPYFFPVNGPLSGGSVTSMRNSLYPHQSSLYFTCDKLNGGNYWQEGLDRGQILSEDIRIVEQRGERVVIVNECIWNSKGSDSPVKDFRKIIISSPSQGIYQIDFEIAIVALTDIEILKTNHSLFSARMASDLSVVNGGTMINAQGETNEEGTFGKKTEWIDYYGKRGGIMEGLAIFQHPSNPGYPFAWFTRDYGLFSPMPTYWQDRLFIPMNKEIRLRYRVLVHGGDYNEADIAGYFKKYSEE